MNRFQVIVVVALMSAGLQAAGAQRSGADAEALFASAEHKAAIDGDLPGAIEDFKRAIAAAATNRPLTARALLRIAECHQKLGNAEAGAIYERLVREFADQKSVITAARARLAASGVAQVAKGDRSVWAGHDADGFGTISPDGRYLTYTDWTGGANLMLRDLVSGTNHRLTAGGNTQFSAISKDGRYVAYEWLDPNEPRETRVFELRVAQLQAHAISAPRRIFVNSEVLSAAPHDWSPDGKLIAVGINRRDGTRQIALITVADGALRVLKSIDWRESTRIFFSPDGRFIAYDLPPADADDERHVFVMTTDGRVEVPAVAHASQNAVMGWTPDGRHLLFSSDRSGSFGLWAVGIDGGRPIAPATLIKADVRSSWSLGLSKSGTMYVWKAASPVFVQASRIDLAAGTIAANSTIFQQFITSRGRPQWSADGKQVVYQSCNPLGAGPCTLSIRSMDTGQVRDLKVKLKYFFYTRWSPDGRELLARASDLKGRNNGLYRINAQTGESTLIASPFSGESVANWSADGRYVYYKRGTALIERDLSSAVERTLINLPASTSREVWLAPDGAHAAYTATSADGEPSAWILPLSGGSPRLLLQGTANERLFGLQWTSEGRALTVVRETGAERGRSLWLLPADGQPARKLGIDISSWWIEDGYSVDSAGKRIAFVAAAGQPGLEIRALENVAPASAAITAGAKR